MTCYTNFLMISIQSVESYTNPDHVNVNKLCSVTKNLHFLTSLKNTHQFKPFGTHTLVNTSKSLYSTLHFLFTFHFRKY